MEIIVQKLTPVNKDGSLRAFVDLAINKIEVKGCRIIQQDGQQAWLSMPQTSWQTTNGQKKYSAVVVLPKDLHKAAQEAAVTAWEAQS